MKTFFKKNLKYSFLLGAIFFISCSKDDPDAINEQEYISNVIVTLASEDGETQTIDWDLSEMNSQNINLKLNTNYNVNLSFLDTSDPTDVENITLEIIDEADEHQVFFEFAEVSVNVSSASNDTKVGTRGVLINSVWNATTTGTGLVRLYLIHQPTNFNATTREGFGGYNDVSIDIPVTIVE